MSIFYYQNAFSLTKLHELMMFFSERALNKKTIIWYLDRSTSNVINIFGQTQ